MVVGGGMLELNGEFRADRMDVDTRCARLMYTVLVHDVIIMLTYNLAIQKIPQSNTLSSAHRSTPPAFLHAHSW